LVAAIDRDLCAPSALALDPADARVAGRVAAIWRSVVLIFAGRRRVQIRPVAVIMDAVLVADLVGGQAPSSTPK
jgi:hypothetical protein